MKDRRMSPIPVLVILFVNVSFIEAECLRGWLHFEKSCYFLGTTHKTWADASSFCRAFHSELATITSLEENNFLADNIAKIKGGLTRSIDYDFWIDGTDEVVEGLWVWASTGKPLTYKNYAPNQVNPNADRRENCLEMVQWDDHIGQWNDDVCTDEEYFICEMELPASSIVG